MSAINTLHPAVHAADAIVAAIGRHDAQLVLAAIRAGWLTPAEADALEPLAAGIGFLLGVDVPAHRERPATVAVVPTSDRELADAVARRIRAAD